jgi:hypothetical protein
VKFPNICREFIANDVGEHVSAAAQCPDFKSAAQAAIKPYELQYLEVWAVKNILIKLDAPLLSRCNSIVAKLLLEFPYLYVESSNCGYQELSVQYCIFVQHRSMDAYVHSKSKVSPPQRQKAISLMLGLQLYLNMAAKVSF